MAFEILKAEFSWQGKCMRYGIALSFMFVFLVQGCLDDNPSAQSDNDDSPSTDDTSGDTQAPGDIITAFTVRQSDDSIGDYPSVLKLTLRGRPGAEYALRLNGNLIESGNLPATAIVVGPFSGIDTNDNYRLTYATLGEPGEHELELTMTRNGETETRHVAITVGAQCRGENENWFANNMQSQLNQCRNCHTTSPNNNSFAELRLWDKIQDHSGSYFVAHTPALFDATPEAKGDTYTHSGGGLWNPDSKDHLYMIETLFRMESEFSCS